MVLKHQTDQWAGCTEFHLEDGRPLDAARTYVTCRGSAAGTFGTEPFLRRGGLPVDEPPFCWHWHLRRRHCPCRNIPGTASAAVDAGIPVSTIQAGSLGEFGFPKL